MNPDDHLGDCSECDSAVNARGDCPRCGVSLATFARPELFGPLRIPVVPHPPLRPSLAARIDRLFHR